MNFLMTTSQGDLGVFALGLMIAGVAVGLIVGMLGVGGGIVIVTVLYHVLAGIGVDEGLRTTYRFQRRGFRDNLSLLATWNFPDTANYFPVLLSREFLRKPLNW